MAEQRTSDWLRVVYGAGPEPDPPPRRSGSDIAVRQSPVNVELGRERGEHRVRLTVIPDRPGTSWTLYLTDAGPAPSGGDPPRVWWRVEPGSWQPLTCARQRMAEGRGRVRLDVSLRAEVVEDPAARPRLGFDVESA